VYEIRENTAKYLKILVNYPRQIFTIVQ